MSVYETRIIENSDNYCCQISYRPRDDGGSNSRRVRYKHVTSLLQALQAVVIVLSVI
jgi:hypothetical protein